LQEINVVEPNLIGGDQAMLESRRFEEILTRCQYYMTTERETYQAIITALLDVQGGLRRMLNIIGEKRLNLGIATSIPTEIVITALGKKIGIDKPFSSFTPNNIRAIIDLVNTLDVGQIQSLIRMDVVFTTTGINRNQAVLPVFKTQWDGGTYLEVGGSVGITPLEIKRDIGFKSAISVDRISEAEATQISTMVDYSAEKEGIRPIPEHLRGTVAREVQRVWNFDARIVPLSSILSPESPQPIVIGVHNLLQHLIEKDTVLLNCLHALNGNGFLWISGQYNGNHGILYNFVVEMKNGQVIDVFVDQTNKKRSGGKAQNLKTEEEMVQVFTEERGSFGRSM